jgi:hypothetical protein
VKGMKNEEKEKAVKKLCFKIKEHKTKFENEGVRVLIHDGGDVEIKIYYNDEKEKWSRLGKVEDVLDEIGVLYDYYDNNINDEWEDFYNDGKTGLFYLMLHSEVQMKEDKDEKILLGTCYNSDEVKNE